MNLGAAILALRKQKNVTQEDMAAELGVTAAAISKWENHYTLPDILMLCALADYFQVSTDELLGRNRKLKKAIVVAWSQELADKISALASQYGIQTEAVFETLEDAFVSASENQQISYILLSCREPLTEEVRNTSPGNLTLIECVCKNEEETLSGFEMMLRNLRK